MKEKDFKKEYQKFFNNLKVDNSKKNKIINNILDNKKKKYILKPSVAVFILIISIFIGGITYATVKTDFYNTLSVKFRENKKGKKDAILNSHAIKELNYQADVKQFDDNDKYLKYTYDELESKLGIKLLKNDALNKAKLYFSNLYKDQDNNIKNMWIWNTPKISTEKYFVGLFHIRIITKYADRKISEEEQDYIDKMGLAWSYDAKEVFIKNLNTMAVVSNDSDSSLRYRFDYDNVIYGGIMSFRDYKNLSEDDKLNLLNEFLETLRY